MLLKKFEFNPLESDKDKKYGYGILFINQIEYRQQQQQIQNTAEPND